MAIGLAAVTLSLSLGCASLRTRRADARDVATADRRVLEGCYDCLLDARAVYARVAATRDRSRAAAATIRLFETELLVALREKELALDWRSTMERARALVPGLPDSLQPRRLLDVVDAVLPDMNGVPPSALAAMRAAHEPYVARLPTELAWLAQSTLRPAFRDYLGRSLECAYPTRRGATRAKFDSLKPRHEPAAEVPPLVLYQAGICTGGDSAVLQRVRAAVPAFVEAAYHLGQTATFTADETGGDDARALLGRAYARFPRAPGVTFYLGWLGTVTGNCSEAVRYYGETVAIEPAHEQALLQGTICLTTLRQDSAAIAMASQLIALEVAGSGQAYHWRALNRLRRQELELARSDIEMAKQRTRGAVNVLTLAGVIEYDQDDLSVAERDLVAARAGFGGEQSCTAAWYLGLIQAKGSRWREAGTSFAAAVGCYDRKVSEDRATMAFLRGHPRMTAAVKARRIAALEAEIAEQQVQYFAGAFNAANNFARAGEVTRATELLDIAARDPAIGEQVAKLRAALAALVRDPPRWSPGSGSPGWGR